MEERCRSINPEIICDHAFVTDKTVNSLIDRGFDHDYQYDNQMAKAALISHRKNESSGDHDWRSWWPN